MNVFTSEILLIPINTGISSDIVIFKILILKCIAPIMDLK